MNEVKYKVTSKHLEKVCYFALSEEQKVSRGFIKVKVGSTTAKSITERHRRSNDAIGDLAYDFIAFGEGTRIETTIKRIWERKGFLFKPNRNTKRIIWTDPKELFVVPKKDFDKVLHNFHFHEVNLETIYTNPILAPFADAFDAGPADRYVYAKNNKVTYTDADWGGVLSVKK